MTKDKSLLPSVAAVIVTYNRLEQLRLTLDRTLAQPFSQVIVINNASTDGTADYLQEIADVRLRVIHKKVNQGGAGGFSVGFDVASYQTDVEWLVCFDDDAYPADGALEAFAELAPGAEVGGVAAAVYFQNGDICPMNRPGIDLFQSPRLLWQALHKKTSKFGISDEAYLQRATIEVCFSSFVGCFVRCDLIRKEFGLPKAELFIYADDTLYTLSIVRKGYKLLFAPTVRFVHDCSTLAFNRRVYTPLWKAYYVFRNGILFYKEFSGSYFYVFFPVLLLSWLLPTLRYSDRKAFLRIARIAILDGLLNDMSKTHSEIIALSCR